MGRFWMVRAGRGGQRADEFVDKNVVAVGWSAAGDLTAFPTVEAMRNRVEEVYPGSTGKIINNAAVLHKFAHLVSEGDRVVTYDPEQREYILGVIAGPYRFEPELVSDLPNVRAVAWDGRVSRDELTVQTRNSLGSTLALFEPGDEVLAELEAALRGESKIERVSDPGTSLEVDENTALEDTLNRAHEFIKDKILGLDPEEMEHLAAALLRAMGYKTRVSPRGPDQGRDVIASPDGLGFADPRILVEVKHRPKEAMGAERIRSFIGGLRAGDRGLYVSTGGFSKEARYEAGRSVIPVTLVDSDYLAALVVEHYEAFDAEGRSLVPLKKVYWPLA